MAKKKKRKKPPNQSTANKRGPEPLRVKIEGDWADAVAKAMRAGKPPKKKRRAVARI